MNSTYDASHIPKPNTYHITPIFIMSSFNEKFDFAMNRPDHSNPINSVYHTHEFIELAYVCQGKGVHHINGKLEEVAKGDLLLIKPKTIHSFFPFSPNSHNSFEVINSMFMIDFIYSLLNFSQYLIQAFSLIESENNYYKINTRHDHTIEYTLEKMFIEFESQKEVRCDILRFELCELLIKIYDEYSYGLNKIIPENSYEAVEKCIEYINKNYTKQITIDLICKEIFVSKSYISKLFKKTYNTTIMQYINKLRIEKSCEIIKNSNFPITNIHSMVGFCSYLTFSQNFKKITGLTATEYRNFCM